MVIGAGPAGVVAACRAADLGATVTLITRNEFGGMAANDGPIPVRTLAQAARLLREAANLGRFGITTGGAVLEYPRLLARVRDVVTDLRAHSLRPENLQSRGVTIHEKAGTARFLDPHTVETESGLRYQAEKFILCGGGLSRTLEVPGFELTATHSDAWALTEVPPSILVLGGGATGAQVASIFNAFGSKVQLFQSGNRILTAEDEDVSAAVAAAFRKSGIVIREGFGQVESFDATPNGVRMTFAKDGVRDSTSASLVVVAVGWVTDTDGLNLAAAGVETTGRGFVQVDGHLRTSAPHVFAAGDITGRIMLVPQASHDGFVAATNAVGGLIDVAGDQVSPIGSFTEPEYAQVGLTEAKARESYDVVVAVMRFNETARTIIDGHTTGFCKLIADRESRAILGCHVVGERAVEIVQVVAIAMAARMRVDDLARVPLSFPTYAGILSRTAYRVAEQLNLKAGWQGYQAQD